MLQRNQIATSFHAAPRVAAGRSGWSSRASTAMTTPSPSWSGAPPRSAKAAQPRWSGWSSTRRSIRPAPAPLPADLIDPDRFPVFRTGRGGEYTYHGPGQRVAYVMLDLKRRREDVRAFVAALEAWIIGALASFNVKGERREDRVGVWVARPDKPPLPDGAPAEDKIAAIGIRLRRWVSFHGIALNVEPDLSHFGGIVPCGVTGHGVTSLVDLGLPVTMADADAALREAFVARVRAGRAMWLRSHPEGSRLMRHSFALTLAALPFACARSCARPAALAQQACGRPAARSRQRRRDQGGRACEAADGGRRQSLRRRSRARRAARTAATRPMRWSPCRPCSGWSSRNPPASAAARFLTWYDAKTEIAHHLRRAARRRRRRRRRSCSSGRTASRSTSSTRWSAAARSACPAFRGCSKRCTSATARSRGPALFEPAIELAEAASPSRRG